MLMRSSSPTARPARMSEPLLGWLFMIFSLRLLPIYRHETRVQLRDSVPRSHPPPNHLVKGFEEPRYERAEPGAADAAVRHGTSRLGLVQAARDTAVRWRLLRAHG